MRVLGAGSKRATAPATTDAGPEPLVRIRNLRKRFRRVDGSDVPAVDDVSLDILPGEFIVLLGPSGCGKTTLLRCVAGLERPDAGEIVMSGRTVFSSDAGTNVPTRTRPLSMMFQSYALWPHMTAFANVAYPLQGRGLKKAEIAERVSAALEQVGIAELAGQHPGQLSGGQQQRVALARALVSGDGLILFDEPLSNVDAKVRERLRLELLAMQHRLGFSALYVTHDQAEAMQLADRIAVMRDGRVAQIGPPRTVYNEPTSRYVADFVGVTNELEGTVEAMPGEGCLEVATRLGPVRATSGVEGVAPGEDVVLIARPEQLTLSTDPPEGAVNCWAAAIEETLFSGPHVEYLARSDDVLLRVWQADGPFLEPGTAVWVTAAPDKVRAVAP